MSVWSNTSILKKPDLNDQIEVLHNVDGISISLRYSDRNIIVRYTGLWFSYTTTPTNFFFKKINSIKNKKGVSIEYNNFFYRIKNSDYLEWIQVESNRTHEYFNIQLNHLVFIGSNIVFELLTPQDPKFTFSHVFLAKN